MSWNPEQALPAGFHEVATKVYRDDRFWLGENAEALTRAFSTANPYFEKNRAWLGLQEGKARLAGFFEPGKTINDEAAAFFGYWEGMDDLAAHQSLFAEFEQWAREQGAQKIYGPINFTTFGSYRLRISGFEQGAFQGEPWNPTYYPALLETLGYQTCYRYRTDIATDLPGMVRTNAPHIAVLREKAAQAGLRVENLTPDYWLSQLDQLYAFIDLIFGGNFAYSRISKEAFVAACGEPFARTMCPQTSVVVKDRNDNIAGFFLCFPDYSPLCRQATPGHTPLSEIRFDRDGERLPSPRLLLAKTTGVHPDYRSAGLFTLMSMEVTIRAVAAGYAHAASCLVREDNNSISYSSRHKESTMSMDPRWYALYAKAL